MTPDAGSPDTGEFRTGEFDAFVEGLDYPMFVVTTAHDDRRAGCLVGFTTQASISPPRMLVCLSVNNRTYDVARDASVLAVHVLEPAQDALAGLFGGTTGDDVDKFQHCRWRRGPDGVPLLEECPRRLVGAVVARHELGDHVGFLLEPMSVEVSATGEALDYERVKDLEPGHPA